MKAADLLPRETVMPKFIQKFAYNSNTSLDPRKPTLGAHAGTQREKTQKEETVRRPP